MIGRDTGGGSSFKGAGLYYLHDRNADTDERVAFTHTENLLTGSAEKSLKVMAWTAMHQADLKLAAGIKTTGRKLEKPVQTFVLSWAPGEEPDHAHMIETARSAMEALGLGEHEALYVGHDDTDKRHVHIIVNRVHPGHGKAATLSKSRLALSKWAESYEREHGIHCTQRIENNARRAGGDRVIDLASRRRNAEQFSDWRGDRQQAATQAREKQRFEHWITRKKAALAQDRQQREARLIRAQDVQQQQVKTRLATAYDTKPLQARMAALEASLAMRGVKGLWHRLTGRAARDSATKEALAKTIAAAKARHTEALQGMAAKLRAQRAEFAAELRHKHEALELRIENARDRREREGWKSHKTDQPRDFAQLKPANDVMDRAARVVERLNAGQSRMKGQGREWER